MFGIGGGEIFFIIIIALMLFGSDNIPHIARTLGKGIAQIKNATDDIKSEIQKSAEENGLDAKTLTGGLTDEIEKVKGGFNKMVADHSADTPQFNIKDVTEDISNEINKAKQTIDEIDEGPIKRQG